MKIQADTIARTIVLALALFNQVLAVTGKGTLDIAENDIYQIVSLVWTLASAVVAWWFNNDFTKEAIEAGAYLKRLRNAKKYSDADGGGEEG
jgi:SPP1 family holin